MERIKSEIVIPSVTITALGALIGSLLAVKRHQPIPLYAASTALNTSLITSSIFTLRYAFLSFSPDREKAGKQVVASGLAGGVAGTAFGTIRNRTSIGSRGSALGVGVVYALSSSLLQGTALSALAVRDSYISPQAHARIKQQEADGSSEAQERQVKGREEGWMKTMWRRRPFRKIPDEEYKSIMEGRVADLDSQIRLVDLEIERTKSQCG